jgi:uncharacterized protein (TIGR04141 family)
LDDKLVAAVRKKKVGPIYLAPPELIDWAQHPTFSYTHATNQRYDDLDIIDYLNAQPSKQALTIQDLKQHRVTLHWTDEEGAQENKWSVYECITFETASGNASFVLTGGAWFQVAKTLNDRGLRSARCSCQP